jgi:hypothetical protein
MSNRIFLETTFISHSSLPFKLVYLVALALIFAPLCLPHMLEEGWTFWPRLFFLDNLPGAIIGFLSFGVLPVLMFDVRKKYFAVEEDDDFVR